MLPKDKIPVIRIAAMPKDTNAGGSIFGGWIMSHIDMAASIPALERAKGRVVTVGVNSIEFHEPVFVGDPHDPRTGVIVCQMFDAEHTRSVFALFDAFRVARGPVGILRLREPIPLLFHATFQSL